MTSRPPPRHHHHTHNTHEARRDMPGRAAGGLAGKDGAKLAGSAATTGGCALTVPEAVLWPSAMGWLENKYRRLWWASSALCRPSEGKGLKRWTGRHQSPSCHSDAAKRLAWPLFPLKPTPLFHRRNPPKGVPATLGAGVGNGAAEARTVQNLALPPISLAHPHSPSTLTLRGATKQEPALATSPNPHCPLPTTGCIFLAFAPPVVWLMPHAVGRPVFGGDAPSHFLPSQSCSLISRAFCLCRPCGFWLARFSVSA